VPADEFEEGEDSPDFFTKIELGKKLVLDAIEKGIQFKEVLFDEWYLCQDFVSFIRDQGKDWISTLKSNEVTYRLNKGRRIRKKIHLGSKFRVQSLGGIQRIVISKPDPHTKDMKRIFCL
jgi:hypothetical protein